MDTTSRPSCVYLELASAQLVAGDVRKPLTPKLFSMLRYFAENPGRLITKQELLEQVWPDTHVSEGLVKDYVRKVRRVLTDDAERPRFIETARGMGYRLVGEIIICGKSHAPGMDASRKSAPTVAVVPFVDASKSADQEHFATGIAEDIIAELARFRSLIVIARDSSFLHGAEPLDVTGLAHELAADYLVQGTVRKAGERVRINVQLCEPGSGSCIWAEHYDRRLEDVFAVQDDVARAVVSKLVGHVEESGRQCAARKRTENLAVYEHLLIGNWHLRQGSETDIVEARQAFQRAIDLEPTNARAYAEMAFSHLIEFWSDWSPSPQGAVATALGLARKATSLDDLDSRAHLYLAAAYHYGASNFEAASLEYDKAIHLNPNDYDAFCLRSWLLVLSGQAEQGISCAETALRLSPLTTEDCRVAQCFAAYGTQRYDEALAALCSITEPTNDVNAFTAMCHAQLGQDAKAKAAMSDFLAAVPRAIVDSPGDSQNGWRSYWATRYPFKYDEDFEHFLEGLSKASLPMAQCSE